MRNDDIVKIIATRGNINISKKDVGTTLILGSNSTSPNRVDYFTSMEGIDSIVSITDPEYLAAQTMFSQTFVPSRIAIGRQDAADASDWTVTLNAIMAESSDWFGIALVTTRVVADQTAVAVWAQANQRMCVFVSDDVNIIDVVQGTDLTSIAAVVNDQLLYNSSVIYHSLAATQYADAGALAVTLTQAAGSYTLAHTAIIGITPDNLTPTQEKNVFDKKASIYSKVAGLGEVDFGNVGDGDWFDTVHFMYWLKVNLQEAIIGLFKVQPKVKYRPKGFGQIEASCVPVFQEAIRNDGLDENNYDENGKQIDGWVMTFPDFATISTQDKSDRILKDVNTNVWYTGAIQKVEMDLNITI